jgi:hypothetical protein
MLPPIFFQVQTDMGGANAAVTVDQSVGFIVGRVLGELGPADSGTFFGADGPEPF